MPIGIDPTETAKVKLKFDSNRPEEVRVTFECRFLSVRDSKKVAAAAESSRVSKDEDESDRLINEAILVGIVGWENATDDGENVPFSAENLSHFTWYQKYLIACQYPGAMTIAEIDRKKSVPSLSVTSAPDAAAPAANA